MNQRSGVEIDIPEDAAIKVHVLQFVPATVTEFVHLYGQGVLPVQQVIGDVKAVGRVAVLTVSHRLAVEVHIVGSFHALEVDVNSSVGRTQALVYGKVLAVQTHRSAIL